MASKAVTRVSADWSKLSQRLNQSEIPKLNKLKSQIDATAIKVSTLPDTLPKIDWAHYKAHASDPKIVEEIEKKYSAIKVETPKVPASRLNELKVAQEQDEARYHRFVTIAESYIESAGVVKKNFENMIPVKDMMREDWVLTFPYWSPTIENPSLSPHLGRTPGLSLEEAIAFEQPDPIPFTTKTAWKDWEERKKKFYSPA